MLSWINFSKANSLTTPQLRQRVKRKKKLCSQSNRRLFDCKFLPLVQIPLAELKHISRLVALVLVLNFVASVISFGNH